MLNCSAALLIVMLMVMIICRRDVTIPVVLMQREAFAQVRSLLQNQTPTPPHPQSVPGNVRGGRDEL